MNSFPSFWQRPYGWVGLSCVGWWEFGADHDWVILVLSAVSAAGTLGRRLPMPDSPEPVCWCTHRRSSHHDGWEHGYAHCLAPRCECDQYHSSGKVATA